MLIDKADLFLKQRKEGDLQRNSLCIIFLRTIEYYKGLLFRTTNRPGHINDSFVSRITYPIAYPNLSQATKKKLVRKFVDRFEDTGTILFEKAARDYLINNCSDFNGRQIQNLLRNAAASAETKLRSKRRFTATLCQEEPPTVPLVNVTLRHMKAAVEGQSDFQSYLGRLRCRDEKARARNKPNCRSDNM